MDRTADPCHDFFQYACGSWNRKHVIPEDRSSISTFEVMADQLQVVLKGTFQFKKKIVTSMWIFFVKKKSNFGTFCKKMTLLSKKPFFRNFRRKSNQ